LIYKFLQSGIKLKSGKSDDYIKGPVQVKPLWHGHSYSKQAFSR